MKEDVLVCNLFLGRFDKTKSLAIIPQFLFNKSFYEGAKTTIIAKNLMFEFYVFEDLEKHTSVVFLSSFSAVRCLRGPSSV